MPMSWTLEAELAISKETTAKASWLREKIYGETRAMWSLYSDLDVDSRVLVLGTQWGGSVRARTGTGSEYSVHTSHRRFNRSGAGGRGR